MSMLFLPQRKYRVNIDQEDQILVYYHKWLQCVLRWGQKQKWQAAFILSIPYYSFM